MAATANVRTFWGALLSVLLKCIAALGFTTAATRSQTAAPRPVEFAGAECGALAAAAVPPAREAGSSGGSPSGGGREAYRVPAPRACEPLLLDRGRTLPPTMKQRISAEAHGTTPRSRTLPAGTLLVDDGCGGLMTVPAQTAAEQTPSHTTRSAQTVATARRKLAALRG